MPHEKFYPPEPGDYAVVTWGQYPAAPIGERPGYVNLAMYEPDVHEEQRPGRVLNLSRDEVNRMIRALRRARDRAFGSDA